MDDLFLHLHSVGNQLTNNFNITNLSTYSIAEKYLNWFKKKKLF